MENGYRCKIGGWFWPANYWLELTRKLTIQRFICSPVLQTGRFIRAVFLSLTKKSDDDHKCSIAQNLSIFNTQVDLSKRNIS
jgi:hypothetical protein